MGCRRWCEPLPARELLRTSGRPDASVAAPRGHRPWSGRLILPEGRHRTACAASNNPRPRRPPMRMELTEDQLVAAVAKVLSGDAPGVLVGVGDDAAVVEPGSGSLVITTDMLLEG